MVNFSKVFFSKFFFIIMLLTTIYSFLKISMDEKVNDDELYSLIFQSLRHPIRRRILRMLKNDSLTFSKILNNLAIDSGHLSYHLEGLGELLIKNEDG
ncbi:helix-turn-helix transcriptional regulator, partial [Candidatus Bathyarchaeota archaeon]|nr:helix-turn-helix transcriptional regulator [Candidatus Bathyarchaeota archaeon]